MCCFGDAITIGWITIGINWKSLPTGAVPLDESPVQVTEDQRPRELAPLLRNTSGTKSLRQLNWRLRGTRWDATRVFPEWGRT